MYITEFCHIQRERGQITKENTHTCTHTKTSIQPTLITAQGLPGFY